MVDYVLLEWKQGFRGSSVVTQKCETQTAYSTQIGTHVHAISQIHE